MIWRKGKKCLALLVGIQTDEATLENSMLIPEKGKNSLLYNLASALKLIQIIQKH